MNEFDSSLFSITFTKVIVMKTGNYQRKFKAWNKGNTIVESDILLWSLPTPLNQICFNLFMNIFLNIPQTGTIIH